MPSGIKYTIQDMHKLAKSRGGKCLSKKYHNTATKLLWKCEHGHKWRATPSRIIYHEDWCPKCNPRTRLKYTIKDLCTLAARRGGRCQSKEYHGLARKYIWQCEYGHVWESSAYNVIQKKTWCPICSKLKYRRVPNELCRYDTTARGIDEPCHTCSLSLPRELRGKDCPFMSLSESLEAISRIQKASRAREIAKDALKEIRPEEL